MPDTRTPPNPSGLCECGCGETTPIAKVKVKNLGLLSGDHRRFVQGHQRRITVPEGLRWCCGCKTALSPQLFPSRPYGKQRAGTCRECYQQQDRKAARIRSRKNTMLRNQFGICINTYESMLQKQKGVCALCLRPETRKHQNGAVKQLAVDHDHSTGRVRGLLCTDCNRGLGCFKDDLKALQAAVRYLLCYATVPLKPDCPEKDTESDPGLA